MTRMDRFAPARPQKVGLGKMLMYVLPLTYLWACGDATSPTAGVFPNLKPRFQCDLFATATINSPCSLQTATERERSLFGQEAYRLSGSSYSACFLLGATIYNNIDRTYMNSTNWTSYYEGYGTVLAAGDYHFGAQETHLARGYTTTSPYTDAQLLDHLRHENAHASLFTGDNYQAQQLADFCASGGAGGPQNPT